MEYILALCALIIGFLAAWFLASGRHAKTLIKQEEKTLAFQTAQIEAEKQKSVAQETLRLKSEELLRIQEELAQNLELANARGLEVATLRTTNNNLIEKLENQKAEIEELQKRLTAEFENIAINTERTFGRVTVSTTKISANLNPLKEKFSFLRKKWTKLTTKNCVIKSVCVKKCENSQN